MAPTGHGPVTTPEDMQRSRLWTGRFLAAPETLPISFTYGGRRIAGIPADWRPTCRRRRIDANLVESIFEGRDDATGLTIRVECLEYLDYPVVEWVAWLTNNGKTPTPLLEDILALDARFEGATPVLQHCNGDFYSEAGYTPQDTPLHSGDALAFAPQGGRPCDGAFPYFRLRFEGAGLTLAVGWPAQWSATFTGLDRGVHVRAGQETTHLRLAPGERIRTPRLTVMSWIGETPRAINLWRRWYLAHVLPRPDGRPLQPKLACSCNDGGEEFTQATEENQLRFMDRFKARGFDYDLWWIDAGWYPCYDAHQERHWPYTGTWEPDAQRFPIGLKPIADRAAQHGAGLLLWFEPERVTRGSRLDSEHPEWLLKVPGKAEEPDGQAWNRLLDLGNPECRRWLTDHVSRLISENGITVYRQDFNFPPLQYWRDNEAPDRRGLNENQHVQGYLQYWDDLLAAHPGLWIDSCASGGRRNDLETLRRSVPLHYTDYGYGIHPVKLAFHHTLYAWIPYFKETALSWDTLQPGGDKGFDVENDPFSYHCGLAPMLATALDIRHDSAGDEASRQMIRIWRRAADLLLHGDYYPLTPFSRSAAQWVVWQFDRPESGTGLVQGVRHRECPDERLTVRLQGLCGDADYVFENPETGEALEVAGATLLDRGFTFDLPRRTAALWFYSRKATSGVAPGAGREP